MSQFTINHFAIRLLFSTLLVFTTYNPTSYSYVHWLHTTLPDVNAIIALSGIILLIGWFIFLRATLRSLGVIGLGLSLLLFACVIWFFVDMQWLSLDNSIALSWIILIVISLLLAVGMSWSHIRRRMSGQVDTDDVED